MAALLQFFGVCGEHRHSEYAYEEIHHAQSFAENEHQPGSKILIPSDWMS